MFFVRLLPVVSLVVGASIGQRSPGVEDLQSLQKNYNTYLTSPLENERASAAKAIYYRFPPGNEGYRIVQTSARCGAATMKLGNGNLKGFETSGSTKEQEFITHKFLTYFADMKPTSVTQESEITTKQHGDKDALSTKWAFHQNEKKMICDVFLDYDKSKNAVEKAVIACPFCTIQ